MKSFLVALLVGCACGFTPAAHMAPRGVDVRRSAPVAMAGWQDKYAGNAGRGGNKKDKLEVSRVGTPGLSTDHSVFSTHSPHCTQAAATPGLRTDHRVSSAHSPQRT